MFVPNILLEPIEESVKRKALILTEDFHPSLHPTWDNAYDNTLLFALHGLATSSLGVKNTFG